MWTRCCIGDVLTLIQNGVNCKQDKSGVGQKVTRIETIADSTINYERTGFAKLDEKQRAKARLEKGEILFSHINSPIHVGKTAIYDGNEPLFHGINLLRLRTIEEVDSSYFNMFLISLFQSGYWKRTAKQSVNQASVNQTDIKSVPFSYPPLSVQKQIVEKLDAAFADIDRAISVTEKNIENAEALFFSVCKEIINSNQARKSSLDSLFDISSGGTPSKKIESYWNGDIPWYSSGELNYLYTIDPDDCISEEGLKNSNAKLFPRGSLLIGMYDTAALKMSVLDREAAFNQAICGLKPNNNTDIEYIYYALNVVKPDVLKLRSGVRQQNLNQSKIKNIEITCPELSIQKGMSEKLGNIFQKQSQLFEIYVNKISCLIALKSSILIQAFSGELTKDAA